MLIKHAILLIKPGIFLASIDIKDAFFSRMTIALTDHKKIRESNQWLRIW